MNLVHPRSLAATLEAVNDALFHHRVIPRKVALEAARWIATRHGLPRAYANTFAATDRELAQGPRLFTGERVTGAAARHILGEESCRALILLNVTDSKVASALASANESMRSRLCQRERSPDFGWYCCCRCSVSLWRHLSVGGLDQQPQRLVSGIKRLRQYRSDDGRWRAFPFWYTVLALQGIDLREAEEELGHAAKVLARAANSKSNGNGYAKRRSLIAQRALERI